MIPAFACHQVYNYFSRLLMQRNTAGAPGILRFSVVCYTPNAFVTPNKSGQPLMMNNPDEITPLLLAWGDGDQAALERLLPLVMAELRAMAKRYMRREHSGHTLQTTALINEAFIKIVDQTRIRWQNRAHFFAIAAQCMRRILTDYARMQQRAKRGGNAPHLALTDAPILSPTQSEELLALDEALQKLARTDERKSQVVELRYFGGFSDEEIAELLNMSVRTVARDWSIARSWLYREISS
jgi:RNA polymerase sigma factor (TIGR02999 family)